MVINIIRLLGDKEVTQRNMNLTPQCKSNLAERQNKFFSDKHLVDNPCRMQLMKMMQIISFLFAYICITGDQVWPNEHGMDGGLAGLPALWQGGGW